MSVSVIVGGQYGSEGKGKVSYFWTQKTKASAVVRVGGSNSGHIVYDRHGRLCAFRMLPTACLINGIVSILPVGSYIDLPVLLNEIRVADVTQSNLKIDPNAIIIKDEYKDLEMSLSLNEHIGSTLSGTGAAVIARAKRDKYNLVMMAKDIEELKPFLIDTKAYMNSLLTNGDHIVIEGTQGYGLSNFHAKCYPYATSRDTTAAYFLAEAGLSPFDVEHIVMAIRTFPIRVAGDSGPLENEVDWQTVSRESGAELSFEEKTTVTHRVRRVARFSPMIVKEAINANKPNVLVLNHLDYIDYSNKNGTSLSNLQKKFVREVEYLLNHEVNHYGNGEMCWI